MEKRVKKRQVPEEVEGGTRRTERGQLDGLSRQAQFLMKTDHSQQRQKHPVACLYRTNSRTSTLAWPYVMSNSHTPWD